MFLTKEAADSLVTNSFKSLFNRDPKQAGLDYWSNYLVNNDTSPKAFKDTLIAGASGADLDYYNNSLIDSTFNAMFDRDAKDAGKAYYNNALQDASSGVNYGNLGTTIRDGATGSDRDFYNTNAITDDFQDLFKRDPKQGGIDYYSDALNNPNSGVNYGNLAQTILNGASDYDKVSNQDIASGGTGIYDNTTGTTDVSMPSDSNPNAAGWIDKLSGGIDNYFDAYDKYAELPGQIDDWMQNAINRQRITGDHVTTAMNAVANQRAGSGIMGGTEATNLNASVMADLAKVFAENATNIDLTGSQMKAGAIAGLPQSALSSVNSMMNLYGVNAADQQNWAQMAANLLSGGY